MRLLIIAAVSALTAIVVVFLLRKIDGPWSGDTSRYTSNPPA